MSKGKINHLFGASLTLGLLLLPLTSLHANEAFELITRNPMTGALPDGLYNSSYPVVTADGRYVAFESAQANLLTPATNGLKQLFLFDRQNNTLELVSQSDSGIQADKASERPAISADGCRVVFHTAAALTNTDTNTVDDVYMRDRCAQPVTTVLVSTRPYFCPTGGCAGRSYADITPDGRYVVFEDNASIYLHDISTGQNTFIDAAVKGSHIGASENLSHHPVISDNGRRIAFWSYSENLVAQDGNSGWDIFLYDADSSPNVSIVSTDASGIQQSHSSGGISTIHEPAISGDGRFVAFASPASNLVLGDNNSYRDVFVKNVQTNQIVRASVSTAGVEGNSDSSGSGSGYRPALSYDGRWVIFNSAASNLATQTGNNAPNIIAHNILTAETKGFATATSYEVPSISDDIAGKYIVSFWGAPLDSRFSKSGVFLFDSNRTPIANAAADQEAIVGQSVQLNGTGSYDPEGNAIAYSWSQLSGVAVTFTSGSGATATPTFTPTATGTYTFQLVVYDGVQNSDPDTVSINVTNSNVVNAAPIANTAAVQNIIVGQSAQLNGSGSSDPEGHELSYTWTLKTGPAAIPFTSGIASATPTFTPTTVGNYIFQLVVNDGIQNSNPAFESVTVSEAFVQAKILANAGSDRSVNIGDPVVLQGAATKVDKLLKNKKVSYSWTAIAGPESVALKGAKTSSKRSFVPTKSGEYIFGLTTTSGGYSSSEALIKIKVQPAIAITEPTANSVWKVGTKVKIKWQLQGIAKTKKLTLAYSPDAGTTLYTIKRGLAAPSGSYSFKVKATTQPPSNQAWVGVCLEKTPKNDLVCGKMESVFVVTP